MIPNRITRIIFLLMHVSYAQSDTSNNANEEPATPLWVDWLFAIFMIIHHGYYAYKFTNYSLSHIHSIAQEKEEKKKKKQLKKQIKKEKKKKKKLGIRKYKQKNDPLQNPKVLTPEEIDKIDAQNKKEIRKAALNKDFTTQSTSFTPKRSISATFCCCFKCKPKIFTWTRTYYLRLFLRIFTSISCLLAMVLYTEFFMNLFVEYFITVLVHLDNIGYVITLLMIPIIIYVINTIILLSWHSVYVSWKMNCDVNGDLEAVELDGNHHFNLEGNRFLFSYKIEYGELDDAYGNLTFDDFMSSSSSSSDASSTESVYESDNYNPIDLAVIKEEDERDDQHSNNHQKKRSKSDFDPLQQSIALQVTNTTKFKKKVKKRAFTTENINPIVNSSISSIQKQENKENKENKEEYIEKKRKEYNEKQKKKEEAKLKRREARIAARESMGDYFVAVCWRWWFLFSTIIAAIVSSLCINVEIGVNGYFWKLVMRYMVIGGLIWSTIYIIISFILSFGSRMMSWKLLHPNISRIKFFCLIDAKDHEKKNKKWRNCKIITMISSLLLFVVCCVAGGLLSRYNYHAYGFVYFIGIVWISYYINNLFMSCKPYSLIALWTDNIPAPGQNFFAHLQISRGLQSTGHLDSALQITTNQSNNVHIGTNHEIQMENMHINPVKTKKKNPSHHGHHRLSREDVESISITAGISAFAPGVLKASKTQEEFAYERVCALIRRYQKFKYVYKEVDLNKNCCCRWYYKMRLFWNNYKNYWLNVYRPFDEYDMETTLNSTNILHGFHWVKPLLECRCNNSKSSKHKCSACCSYIFDNTCNILLILLLSLIIGISMLFASQISQLIDPSSNSLQKTSISFNQTQYYPICSDYFGSQEVHELDIEQDLTVLDVLFLTQIVYEMDKFDLNEMIDGYFDDEFDIMMEEQTVPSYFHISHTTKNLDYLSIRGTAGSNEALQDISLFLEVGLFETLQWIVPFLNALPTTFITTIIYYASLTERLINSDVRDQFDEPIYEYLTDYLQNVHLNATTLHVLGHSLGGGISQIVASNLYEDDYDSNILSFGVCSPGVLYSSAKFGFDIESLDRTSKSLLPRRDIISKVDLHGGSISYTQCDEQSMFNCHVMGSVICEVYNNCPSELARKPDVFDCFCNGFEKYPGQQFGYCMNVTRVTEYD